MGGIDSVDENPLARGRSKKGKEGEVEKRKKGEQALRKQKEMRVTWRCKWDYIYGVRLL